MNCNLSVNIYINFKYNASLTRTGNFLALGGQILSSFEPSAVNKQPVFSNSLLKNSFLRTSLICQPEVVLLFWVPICPNFRLVVLNPLFFYAGVYCIQNPAFS